MNISQHKNAVLLALRAAARGELRDEEVAWTAVMHAVITAAKSEKAGRLDAYIYELGVLFFRETGSLPGYSKGDNETRFERFVHAIPPPPGVCVTRYSVKSATRRLKANPHFAGMKERPDAAE